MNEEEEIEAREREEERLYDKYMYLSLYIYHAVISFQSYHIFLFYILFPINNPTNKQKNKKANI